MKSDDLKTVWIAHAVTESCDNYYFAFAREPSDAEVVEMVYRIELAEELEWYTETTAVSIQQVDILP